MLELYKNIKKYRKQLGITQQELAIKAGYKDKSMIAKIERGLIDLPQSKIVAFADIFDIQPSDLMGWSDYADGIDGKGTTKIEQFRNSLFYKTAQNQNIISKGVHALLQGLYEVEEIEIDDKTYYKLSRGGLDYYVELILFDALEDRLVSYLKSQIRALSNDIIAQDEEVLNAAHPRNDISVSTADIKHDEDIMDDDDF